MENSVSLALTAICCIFWSIAACALFASFAKLRLANTVSIYIEIY
jgi:hypothetical protein